MFRVVDMNSWFLLTNMVLISYLFVLRLFICLFDYLTWGQLDLGTLWDAERSRSIVFVILHSKFLILNS